jgi:hypothetical protein
VFERPQIFSDTKNLFRTHSHELHIKGTGFPLPNTDYKPKLKVRSFSSIKLALLNNLLLG